MLYIGTAAQRVYVCNSLWGFPTYDAAGQEGRAVVGRVVNMPLDFGKAYSNIQYTLLERAQGLTLLNSRLTHPTQALPLGTAV